MFIKMPKPSRRTVAGLVTFAAMLACIPAYVSGYTVNGPSEAPTLLLGDFAIVNHAAYDLNLPYSTARLAKLGSPQRGDIVLFRVPKRNAIGLKVVVGLPGDLIAMSENRISLNGSEVAVEPLERREFDWVPKEHAIGNVVARETIGVPEFSHVITYTAGLSPLRSIAQIAVPEDGFYLLGDHRDNSNDSRTFGPVPREAILGKLISVWPTGGRTVR